MRTYSGFSNNQKFMKKFLYFLLTISILAGLRVCSPGDSKSEASRTEEPTTRSRNRTRQQERS